VDVCSSYATRAGGKTPRTARSGGGSRMLRGLMLAIGKILWACADVLWRLLFCKVTTKKSRPKIVGPIVVVREGASFRLVLALYATRLTVNNTLLLTLRISDVSLMYRDNDYHHCGCHRCPCLCLLDNHRRHYRHRLRQDASQVYQAIPIVCNNNNNNNNINQLMLIFIIISP